MSNVASTNRYDLLGNTEDDSDTPKAPVKTVDKQPGNTIKRNSDGAAPSNSGVIPTGGNRRGGFTGSEAAFRDRGAGNARNLQKTTDETPRGQPRGGRGARTRGGRGQTTRDGRDDRHVTKSQHSGSAVPDKQGAQTHATEGNAEMVDEDAGEAIAQAERKEANAEGDATATEEVEKQTEDTEPVDNSIDYATYLAQKAERKLKLGESQLEARKANEGVSDKLAKKWANAKAIEKEEDDDFMVGSGPKQKRERERKAKEFVEIDNRYHEPAERGGERGGRGGRGGRASFRGESRGSFRGGAEGRENREPREGTRGEDGGRGRGDRGRGRGGRGGEYRGDFRGGRGGGRGGRGDQPLNTEDSSAFPALGSK